jgi:hypothetical protein
MPPLTTLVYRSTWHEASDCIPILAIVQLHRILQLGVFVWCPFTRTRSRLVNTGSQGIIPSRMTLLSRSTRDQRGNCKPILAIVHLYRILQLVVFVWCPFTRTRSRPDITGIQDIIPPALQH